MVSKYEGEIMQITKKKILGYAQMYTSYKKPIILADIIPLICRNLYVRCPEKKQLIKDILVERYNEYKIRALLEDKDFNPQPYRYSRKYVETFSWEDIKKASYGLSTPSQFKSELYRRIT
jgi:hypothetical protein